MTRAHRGRIGMLRGALVLALLAGALAVSQGASAAPTATFNASCMIGDTTIASWSNFRPEKVEFTWVTAVGTVRVLQSVPRGGPPSGEVSVTSPFVFSESVHVVFLGKGGGAIDAPCYLT
jgi:hypothetical protein